jgi:hypothetical protein
MVYINNGITAELVKCPQCNGTREMKSITTEEKEMHRKQAKEEGLKLLD